MSDDDQDTVGSKRPAAFQLGPRKKPCGTDPLIHHGRHFGRTIHALCSTKALITNGILHMVQLEDEPDMVLPYEECREYEAFQKLLKTVPGLQERLTEGSDENIIHIAELIQKGVSGARSDDTKSLKGVILDWITPQGQPLIPPLSRNVKMDRGFHHERTGALLCPANLQWSNTEVKENLRSGELAVTGDQWPIFLYAGCSYDLEDPWNGLLRGALLVSAYKHVFTSPSSVDKEPKATRSGNARIHGMTKVTAGSIAYIATQVRFALSSSPVFSRTDSITDSERFYNSVLDLLDDVEEQVPVNDLLAWWNRQIFPQHMISKRPVAKDSPLGRIRAKRLALKTNLSNVPS